SIFCFSSRRRHTRSKRDWSSDVCSSDLRQYQRLIEPMPPNNGLHLNQIVPKYLKEQPRCPWTWTSSDDADQAPTRIMRCASTGRCPATGRLAPPWRTTKSGECRDHAETE